MNMRKKQMANALSAWSIRRYGAPEQFAPVTRTMPSPGPDEVLFQIHAFAVTRADGMIRSGTPRWARPFWGFADLARICPARACRVS